MQLLPDKPPRRAGCDVCRSLTSGVCDIVQEYKSLGCSLTCLELRVLCLELMPLYDYMPSTAIVDGCRVIVAGDENMIVGFDSLPATRPGAKD